jgi:hypothetical protein
MSMSKKLRKGELAKNGQGPAAKGVKDAFGFSGSDKKQATAKAPEKSNAPSEDTAPAKAKHDTKSEETKGEEKAAVKHDTFGFGKASPKLGESNKALSKTEQEHRVMERADELHLWVNNKPIDVKAMHTKEAKANAKKKLKVKAVAMAPKKERALQEHKAAQIASDEHIWVNGKPVAVTTDKQAIVKHAVSAKAVQPSTTAATPGHKEPKAPTKTAETPESMDFLRMMKLVVSHVGGRSKAVADQNKILGDNEYNFSIRNTDQHGKAMGTAKNIHLNVKLPKGAQLQDAYFYTEAEGHKKPQSLSCKLEQGDGSGDPKVNCMVPQVKDIVDVYVRAHYDGDQKVLSALLTSDVHGTLHEGHEVLTTAALPAVKRLPLLKRMPHD